MRCSMFVAALALAACAPSTEEAERREAERISAASHEGPVGWLDADAPGESGVVYRAGPNAVGFAISCVGADKRLFVRFETPSEAAKSARQGELFLGAAGFPVTLEAIEGGQIEMLGDAAVTPEILAALASADSARVVVGDAFTATESGGAAQLATLAATCSTITGVAPAKAS